MPMGATSAAAANGRLAVDRPVFITEALEIGGRFRRNVCQFGLAMAPAAKRKSSCSGEVARGAVEVVGALAVPVVWALLAAKQSRQSECQDQFVHHWISDRAAARPDQRFL